MGEILQFAWHLVEGADCLTIPPPPKPVRRPVIVAEPLSRWRLEEMLRDLSDGNEMFNPVSVDELRGLVAEVVSRRRDGR